MEIEPYSESDDKTNGRAVPIIQRADTKTIFSLRQKKWLFGKRLGEIEDINQTHERGLIKIIYEKNPGGAKFPLYYMSWLCVFCQF